MCKSHTVPLSPRGWLRPSRRKIGLEPLRGKRGRRKTDRGRRGKKRRKMVELSFISLLLLLLLLPHHSPLPLFFWRTENILLCLSASNGQFLFFLHPTNTVAFFPLAYGEEGLACFHLRNIGGRRKEEGRRRRMRCPSSHHTARSRGENTGEKIRQTFSRTRKIKKWKDLTNSFFLF